MLSNRLAYSGFSLVEMMISMVLGSTLFLLVSDAYVKSTVSIAKLQQI
ncbi:MAG: prepilin-type N-terminal cleavage/methylation domain-containing protein, partial [Plesiomonas shigelloides]